MQDSGMRRRRREDHHEADRRQTRSRGNILGKKEIGSADLDKVEAALTKGPLANIAKRGPQGAIAGGVSGDGRPLGHLEKLQGLHGKYILAYGKEMSPTLGAIDQARKSFQFAAAPARTRSSRRSWTPSDRKNADAMAAT